MSRMMTAQISAQKINATNVTCRSLLIRLGSDGAEAEVPCTVEPFRLHRDGLCSQLDGVYGQDYEQADKPDDSEKD